MTIRKENRESNTANDEILLKDNSAIFALINILIIFKKIKKHTHK